MTIRKASTADIKEIQQIAALTWPHAYADILSGKQVEYMLNLMYNHAVLAQQMEMEGHIFLLAETESKVVGFAGFSLYEGNTWKLHKLYVLPFQQNSGIGKSLLKETEQQAKVLGGKAIILNVNRHNNAFHFYERMGYSIDAEGDFDIGHGFFMNDYIMKKVLD